MNEKVFFEEGPVRVTNARFIVGSQTYAMNGVTSVKSHMTPPPRALPIIVMVVGFFIAVGADGVGKVLGLAVIGLGIWIWSKQRPTLAVILSSASGEVKALDDVSHPNVDISGVVTALNESIIHRG